MSQSQSKVYVHITFSTKNHHPFIDDSIKISLFEYIGGICKGLESNPVKIVGHHDHVSHKVDYDERCLGLKRTAFALSGLLVINDQ